VKKIYGILLTFLLIISTVTFIHINIPIANASGPTYVSGNIISNTTWNITDSPYIVTDNVTVDESVKLIIESGVTVKLNFFTRLIIDGILIAEGDESQPIIFTSNRSKPALGDWSSIKFNDASNDSSVIKHAKIEYAIYGIWCIKSSPTIINNTITNIMTKGIYLQESSSVIINNTIINVSNRGIDIHQSSPIIDNNLIANTTYYGIRSYKSAPIITDNIVTGSIDGIYSKESSSIITNNTVTSTSYSIYIEESPKTIISDNDIVDNLYGIYLAFSDSTFINKTTIDESDFGIYALSSSPVIINSTISNSELKDFFLAGESHVTAINSTFTDSKLQISSSSTLTVKNYLHVRVEDLDGSSLSNANVEVKDYDLIIYESQTDNNGMCKWILITDRIYFGSITPTENLTIGTVSYDTRPFYNNPRDIDMGTTHTEIFTEATVPITPPIITQVIAKPDPQRIGGSVNISATVTDNVQVYGVWVNIIDPNYNLLGNFSMEYDFTKGQCYYNTTYFIMDTYSFTIWANNTFNKWSYSTGSFTIKDFTPPMIEFINFPSPIINRQTNISVWVTDNVGVNKVLLFYKNIGDDSYSFIEMEKISEGVYVSAIPPQNKAGGVYFYISSNDISGNEVTTDEYTLFIEKSIETKSTFSWASIIIFVLDIFAFLLIILWFAQRRKKSSLLQGVR